MAQGRTLGDRLLTLTWVPDFTTPTVVSASDHSATLDGKADTKETTEVITVRLINFEK